MEEPTEDEEDDIRDEDVEGSAGNSISRTQWQNKTNEASQASRKGTKVPPHQGWNTTASKVKLNQNRMCQYLP